MTCPMQESLNAAESNVSDLKKSLALQQESRADVDAKYQIAWTELDVIKAELKTLKKSAETSQAALTKRVEDAEGHLKMVTEELIGLKQHISRMTEAIFGKYLLTCN